MKKFVALSIGAMMAAPAFAGGMNEPVVAPEVVAPVVVAPAGRDWTGGYAGVRLGYGNVNSSGGVLDGNGAIGGLHAGYLYDFGNWVAGAEIAHDFANIDLGGGAGKLKSETRLAVKAGPDLGKVFVYGTLGLAHGRADIGGVGMNDNGYFGGVGMDYALNDKWTVGGEVLANHFGNFAGTGTDLNPVTAQVGVSYHF